LNNNNQLKIANFTVICRAKALYDYDPIGSEGNNLVFQAGDIIDVIKKVHSFIYFNLQVYCFFFKKKTLLKQKDGWWEGVCNGYIGFFYNSFVEVLENEPEMKQNQTNNSSSNLPHASKKKHGTGFAASVPKICIKDLVDPDYEGYLWKEGGNVKNWKKRWFVLKDFCLYYFDTNKPDSLALGVILTPSYVISGYPNPKWDFSFQVFFFFFFFFFSK